MTLTSRRALRLPALSLAATTLAAVPALAQSADAPRTGADPVGTLMMFTLGIALAIGVFLLIQFWRKRSNREAMRRLDDD